MSRAGILETLVAFAVGLLFGLGLVISGMSNPAKVLGFLDIFGRWDPSLAIVMASAVGVGLMGFALDSRRVKSVLGLPMRLQEGEAIDLRLVAGAVVFGLGWGLVGLCPGPAVVALAGASPGAFIFVGAMLAGMALYEATSKRAVPPG
jgi:uncharacterized membrane protein YedE/YeeE